MNRLSRPLVYGVLLLLLIVAGALYSQDNSSDTKPPAAKPKSNSPMLASSEFDRLDYVEKFDKPNVKPRNLFQPASQIETAPQTAPSADIDRIPADFAHGEASWIYTGLAEVDGVRMALIENSQTHQGGFVKEGETWKTCHVQGITTESVILVDSKGNRQVVMRFNPNKPAKEKPTANAGLQPAVVTPAPSGPIGPNMVINALPPAVPPGSRVSQK
jgi:hypothetical protein